VTQATVLVLYYSRGGRTAALARQAALGVESAGAVARLRTVPPVTAATPGDLPAVPADGPPYAELADLADADGLLLGSPTRFGNMAAPLKHFLDTTSELWVSGRLKDKPAGVFTSSSSAHGGQESTLLSMQLPLLHHGMLIVGVPYTEPALFDTRTGGSPYGATHVATSWNTSLSTEESTVARVLGSRVARIAQALAQLR
jgi:NAD(P)H dehydrogenase (quinone)